MPARCKRPIIACACRRCVAKAPDDFPRGRPARFLAAIPVTPILKSYDDPQNDGATDIKRQRVGATTYDE
jgi:hypothetical protein